LNMGEGMTAGTPLRGTNLTILWLKRVGMTRQRLNTLFCAILVVVVGLSAMGFTRTVGYCSMSDSAECCCGNDKKCDLPASQTGLFFASVANACYSVRTVGGLNEITAVSSPENLTKQVTSHSIVELAPTSGHDFSHQLASLNYLRSDHSPPPDCEIYIQTHSLLI